jgi:acyl-homoserine lactone acylase PvdQ
MAAVEDERRLHQAVIYRDDWGVPHIEAEREEDGFFGLGYAQAEDQLEPMLGHYLDIRSERAAAFGPAYVDADFGALRWRHRTEAEAAFETLSPQLQTNYRGFIAGIQRFITDHPEKVPSWTPRLDPWLPIAVERSQRWVGYMGIEHGFADLKAGGVQLDPRIQAELEDPSAPTLPNESNQWCLMPWRTAFDATVLLGDPHGGFGNRYEFTMHAGRFEVAGHTDVGIALPIFGHTRYLAWTTTTGYPDVGDIYATVVDPEAPCRYRYDDAWRTMVVEEATIQVKGSDPVTRVFEYTDHNGIHCPVVARQGNTAYALATPYMVNAGIWDEQVYRQNLATSMEEFIEAQRLLGFHAENVMAASADGHTYYIRFGRVPVRSEAVDWRKPVPGNTSETAWRGLHPSGDLVQIQDPESGYMQNNNVSPDTMMEDSPLTAGRYPSYIFGDTPGRMMTRGLRGVELLSKTFAATVRDVQEIALDERWVTVEAWQDALRQAVSRRLDIVSGWPPAQRRLLDRVLRFDGYVLPDSVAALSYVFWRTGVALALGFSEAGLARIERKLDQEEPLTASEARLDAMTYRIEAAWDPRLLKVGFSGPSAWSSPDLSGLGPVTAEEEAALVSGIDKAAALMMERYGTTELRYGDVFRIGRGGTSYPASGGSLYVGSRGDQPLRVFWFEGPDQNQRYWATGGGRGLRLTIFTDPIQSFSVVPFGISADPNSPHHSDQARLVSERRLKPTYFNQDELAAHTVSTMILDYPGK